MTRWAEQGGSSYEGGDVFGESDERKAFGKFSAELCMWKQEQKQGDPNLMDVFIWIGFF